MKLKIVKLSKYILHLFLPLNLIWGFVSKIIIRYYRVKDLMLCLSS